MPEICDDGIDNDLDGLVDCEDDDCAEDIEISVSVDTHATCSDGLGQITVSSTTHDLSIYQICMGDRCADEQGVISGLPAGDQDLIITTMEGCIIPYTITPEICGNGIDDDGDGYIDCEDLDCILGDSSLFKSNDVCIDLSETDFNLLEQYNAEFEKYGMNASESLLALNMIKDELMGLSFQINELCNSGNDIFDINGNHIETDDTNEHGIKIRIGDELYDYCTNEARMSAESHDQIGRYYLDNYLMSTFPLVGEVGIRGISNSASDFMGIGSLDADILPNEGEVGECVENIGIKVTVSGLPDARITSCYYNDKLKYINTLEHELNHLFAEFDSHKGYACQTSDVENSMNHVVIVWLQFKHSPSGECFDYDNNEIDKAWFFDIAQEPIRRYLQLLTSDQNLGVTNAVLIQWIFCNYLSDFLPQIELDYLKDIYDLSDC